MAILKLFWACLVAAFLALIALVSGCSFDPAAGASWKFDIHSPNFGDLKSDIKLTPGILEKAIPAPAPAPIIDPFRVVPDPLKPGSTVAVETKF